MLNPLEIIAEYVMGLHPAFVHYQHGALKQHSRTNTVHFSFLFYQNDLTFTTIRISSDLSEVVLSTGAVQVDTRATVKVGPISGDVPEDLDDLDPFEPLTLMYEDRLPGLVDPEYFSILDKFIVKAIT